MRAKFTHVHHIVGTVSVLALIIVIFIITVLPLRLRRGFRKSLYLPELIS